MILLDTHLYIIDNRPADVLAPGATLSTNHTREFERVAGLRQQNRV